MGQGFHSVWSQLLRICHDKNRYKESVRTLVQNAEHHIEHCSNSGIRVRVQSSGKSEFIKKEKFQKGWEILKKAGGGGTDLSGHSIDWRVKVILAYLPDVEYDLIGQQQKRMWYLMPNNTHKPGTRKRLG